MTPHGSAPSRSGIPVKAEEIPTKRLEIVTDTLSKREVWRAGETPGASGDTVLPAAAGTGEAVTATGSAASSKSVCLMTASPDAELGPPWEAIRPLLRERRGMGLVSDAHGLLP